MMVCLGQNNIFASRQVTWLESLEAYRGTVKGDWIKVFARALAIYKGQVKGLAGVPETTEVRESLMKAELKLLIRDIM